MDARQLAHFAKIQLGDILDRSSELLYSGTETLQPGVLYLVGLNPGGYPTIRPWPD